MLVENTVWDPELRVCSTPLGSPTSMSKRSYVHVPLTPRPCHQRRMTRAAASTGLGGYQGGYSRVGSGRGYTGVLPSHRVRSKPDSEAGPVGPSRAGVGGRVQRARVPGTTLRARSAPVPPCTWDPLSSQTAV